MVSTGLLDWRGVAKVMSERPAQIVGLTDQGRPIAVGEPANLAVVDAESSWTVKADELASLSRNTPYADMTLPATIRATVLRGRSPPTRGGAPMKRTGIRPVRWSRSSYSRLWCCTSGPTGPGAKAVGNVAIVGGTLAVLAGLGRMVYMVATGSAIRPATRLRRSGRSWCCRPIPASCCGPDSGLVPGTTFAPSWQNKDHRRRAERSQSPISPNSPTVSRSPAKGAGDIWIPRASVTAVRTESGHGGKVMGQAGSRGPVGVAQRNRGGLRYQSRRQGRVQRLGRRFR